MTKLGEKKSRIRETLNLLTDEYNSITIAMKTKKLNGGI